ncbi:MAG: WbqC family protein [Crocinitomicaceae bacterium]|jgi:hypothetical protein
MNVFPTAYFPSIYYLKEFFCCSNPLIEIQENFPKQTIRNRCEILTSNGLLTLSIPVLHNSSGKQLTKDVRIDYSKNWQIDHWRAIQSAYASAPYFEDYFEEIKSLINYKSSFLLEQNEQILGFIESILEIKSNYSYTNKFENKIVSQKNLFLEQNKIDIKPYQQVFGYNKPFVPNLSILDLIFNEGPFCRNWMLTPKN